jgi:hypothetical protein
MDSGPFASGGLGAQEYNNKALRERMVFLIMESLLRYRNKLIFGGKRKFYEYIFSSSRKL